MAMSFDSPFGCTEQMGNLLVRPAAHHQRKDFGFPWCQGSDERLIGTNLIFALLFRRMSDKRLFDCRHQRLPGNGL